MGTFDDIYRNNDWRDDESVSGKGSSLEATSTIRSVLPLMFGHYDITRILDIPCGDMNWIQHILTDENITYIGADIVPELIDRNINKEYLHDNIMFRLLDITRDDLPTVDLVLVRDLFGHLPNAKIKAALKNIRRSGSTYLLATTFPHYHGTEDGAEGAWRPINLAEYWGLGNPLEYINEHCTVAGFEDKSLGLWRLK